jgi:O-antigen ligase
VRSEKLITLRSTGAALLLTGAAAVSFFAIAYDNGSCGLPSRCTLAIALWWAISMGVLFGIVKLGQLTRPARVIAALLAAFCLWTLISIIWAPSAENAFNEFNRVSLFLAVFLLLSLLAGRGNVDRWADGLTLAIVAIALVALTSRLFPGVFPGRGILASFPTAAIRLNFPLGYWNGLATFVALGIPLALRVAIGCRNSIVRGIALASLPIAASVIYLASSRGGALTALVGTAAFFALSERRWSLGSALVVGGLGSAAAIHVLRARSQLVGGPLGTDLVERQGHSAALLILLICVLTAAVYGLGSYLLRERAHPPRRLGQALVAAFALLLIVGLVASHPIRRFENFKRLPAPSSTTGSGYATNEHLLMGSGNGRWQLWSSAVDQWQHHVVVGNGAGSFSEWWARYGSTPGHVEDAHSLYFETLGELGLVGFSILALIFLVGALAGIKRSLTAGDRRITTAALTAAFGAYAVEVAFDWMWELTVVSIVAWVVLALALSSPKAPERDPSPQTERRPSQLLRKKVPVAATVLLAWVLITAQAIPLLAQTQIEKSQAALARRDGPAAEDAAVKARRIQPWAATPALQLALVLEREGKLVQADSWIREAIKRDETDWGLWLVSTRIDVKRGEIGKAITSLKRAIQLNPRSPRMIQLAQILKGKATASPS